MTINPEHLLNFPIPDVRHVLTKRETVFYALSVGLGQDPTDERQLDFVDHQRNLRALPWLALVSGYPGFWLGDPHTGVDALRLVLGEQELELHQTLPVEGELIGRTRVTGLVDKGPGRGALLYSEKQLTDAVTGALLATTRSTTFLRGDGGFGGAAGPIQAPHTMPQTPPDMVLDFPTRPEQALYYRLNGDDNPIHADPKRAARANFPRPILHGLCTLGITAHALLRECAGYDERRFRSLRARFTAPVLPGETIRTEIWQDGSFRSRVVERDVIVIDNGFAEFTSAGEAL